MIVLLNIKYKLEYSNITMILYISYQNMNSSTLDLSTQHKIKFKFVDNDGIAFLNFEYKKLIFTTVGMKSIAQFHLDSFNYNQT